MHHFFIDGIETVIKPIPASNSVTLSVFLDVGLPCEQQHPKGVSHFLEHMCFRGTSRRSAYQITKEVDSLGGQINAYTAKEFTCYYITVLPEYVAEAWDILTDIVFHSVHDASSIELEKSIITEEINMYEDTPDEKIIDLLSETLFGDSYLGKPILGTSEGISTITSDGLRGYYANYYIPENIKFVMAGGTPS
ncbi:MAG: M16 family metallopeptidase, partial [Candidatus Marinamargulisbacteria bacterium]